MHKTRRSQISKAHRLSWARRCRIPMKLRKTKRATWMPRRACRSLWTLTVHGSNPASKQDGRRESSRWMASLRPKISLPVLMLGTQCCLQLKHEWAEDELNRQLSSAVIAFIKLEGL